MHLLRNAFRLAARQDGDEIAKALKPIYTAPTEDTALERLAAFAEFWGKKYPAIIRPWENAWEEFTPVLRFDTSFGSTPRFAGSSAPPVNAAGMSCAGHAAVDGLSRSWQVALSTIRGSGSGCVVRALRVTAELPEASREVAANGQCQE
ncbi:transposase [Streptomyces sp. NBC_01020]|uniref:transposase n=1 Tax=Streptomyces sp. NBC_01020 TaxID=2903722 RepID=UPI00386BCF67|nr:transposase [Streptomyces sp. NBC_01020]